MLYYLFRRLNLLFITVFVLSIITFILTYFSSQNSSADIYSAIRYFEYIADILRGEWGVSSLDQQPILLKGLTAFASTLELCFLAFISANIIALPLGILAGLNRNTTLDYLIISVALIVLSLPVFWLATLTAMFPVVFDINLPIDGGISPIFEVPVVTGFIFIDSLLCTDLYHFDAFLNRLYHLILPSAVLSFFLITTIITITRDAITTVMKSNYIKAAYAKGLSGRQVVYRHVLKNAFPPILHQLRFHLSIIISFAMVIEVVFSIPGSGVWLLNSIKAGDYLALPTSIIITSGFILLASFIIDMFQILISPIKRKSFYVD